MQDIKLYFTLAGSIAFFILCSAIIYLAWPMLAILAPIIIIAAAICIIACFLLGVFAVYSLIERYRTQTRRFAPTEQGYYEALLIDENLFIKPADNIPLLPPANYSPHIEMLPPPSLSTSPETSAPPQPVYDQPDLSTIIEELTPNSLEFIFGLDPKSGELAKITLPQAVHIQLLGASGQGKSRQATSILTQLTTRNDTGHLQLALIDCEGETTAPFQKLPHVRHLADEPKDAARILNQLAGELDRRNKVKVMYPVMLIFVEEFLTLRRTMPESLRDQALEDYTTLALGGRKRGLFLFSIGQTAYTEKAIRDAQAQFLSSMAFAVKPTAARAAGFTNTELLNRLYSERRPGQFLLERPAGDSILLAPYVDSRSVSDLLGTSQSTSWGTSQAQQEDITIEQGTKHPEADTDPIQLCAQDMQILDCMGRGLPQNQIMAEVYGIDKPGSAYQKKLPELRAAMQRIAQFTSVKIGA